MTTHADASAGRPPGPPPAVSFDPLARLLQARVLDPPPRPGLLAGLERYEVLRVLGEGGMGIVLLGRPAGGSRQAAIKLLRPELATDPQAVHRFLVEARHMQRLAHPNIICVLDVSDRPEGPYFVMPFMERGSLARLIQPGRPLEEDAALRIAVEIADALAFAHDKGIIHRDLKPGNVLLDAAGRAHLADFGLGRTTLANETIVDIRREQCTGTAPYLAPEVAAGKAGDFRCDIYSFGAMLYEMLAGHWPYSGQTAQEIIDQVLAGPPAPIPPQKTPVARALSLIAAGAMARELRDRYAHMADVAADLRRVEKGHDPLGPKGQPVQRASRTRRWPIVAAFLLIAGLLIGGLIWKRVAPPSPPPEETAAISPIAGGSQGTARGLELLFIDDFDSGNLNLELWSWGQTGERSYQGLGERSYQISQNRGSLLMDARAVSDRGWTSTQDLWLDTRMDLKNRGNIIIDIELSAEVEKGGFSILLCDGEAIGNEATSPVIEFFQAGGDHNHPLLLERRQMRVELLEGIGLAKVFPDAREESFELVEIPDLDAWKLRFHVIAMSYGNVPPASARLRLHRVSVHRGEVEPGVVGLVTDEISGRGVPDVILQTEAGDTWRTDAGGQYFLPLHPRYAAVTIKVESSTHRQVEPTIFVHPQLGQQIRRDIQIRKTVDEFGDPELCIPLNEHRPGGLAAADDHLLFLAPEDDMYRVELQDSSVRRLFHLGQIKSLGYCGDELHGMAAWPGRLFRIGPDGEVVLLHHLKLDWPSGLAFDGSRIWTLELDPQRNRYGIHAIDPDSGQIVGSAVSSDLTMRGIAYGRDRLWISSSEGVVYVVDTDRLLAAGRVDQAIVRTFNGNYCSLSFDRMYLWGLDTLTNRICRLGLETEDAVAGH